MRNIAIYLIILVIGVLSGYFLNEVLQTKKEERYSMENTTELPSNTKGIESTGKESKNTKKKQQSQNNNNPSESQPLEANSNELEDTTEEDIEEEEIEQPYTTDAQQDSIGNRDGQYYSEDYLSEEKEEEEEDIIKEELLSQQVIPLETRQRDSTDVAEILELKSDAFAKEITVEFWKSPLNLTGYELSRNKLKLFGFNPNEAIDLKINDTGEYLLLNTETMSILLHKNKRFKSLTIK